MVETKSMMTVAMWTTKIPASSTNILGPGGTDMESSGGEQKQRGKVKGRAESKNSISTGFICMQENKVILNPFWKHVVTKKHC